MNLRQVPQHLFDAIYDDGQTLIDQLSPHVANIFSDYIIPNTPLNIFDVIDDRLSFIGNLDEGQID